MLKITSSHMHESANVLSSFHYILSLLLETTCRDGFSHFSHGLSVLITLLPIGLILGIS